MRHSIAVLSGTPVRLSDLRFPARHVQIARTRLAYIHLDNLLHFAKIDRDGRVDAYIAAYLPDELLLLFLQGGNPVTAVAFSERDRHVVSLAAALQQMRDELERGELAFCEAPVEQLAWMLSSGATPARPYPVPPNNPASVFGALLHERFTGVVELIVDGQVSYLRLQDGRFHSGYFADKADDVPVPAYLEKLFARRPGEPPPAVAASVFPAAETLTPQAPDALVDAFRDVFWHIVEAAEREVPGEAQRRALKLRDTLTPIHAALARIGTPRDQPPAPVVTTPESLTFALADWALQLLEQLEVIAPGVASVVLRDATRAHRYVLQRSGFYARLPWPITW